MGICLITAPISTDFEDAGEAASYEVLTTARSPHLGVLSLAAALEEAGIKPLIFNTDRAYYDYLDGCPSKGLAAFADWAAGRIAACGAEVFGFSSICSSYPLTIRIAECVKRRVPDCTIVFGGPQASVVDLPTLEAFGFVDMVLRGEADCTLPVLLEELGGKRRFPAVPGLTYRSPFGLQRTADAPVIQDLDTLPLPAYHLTGELNKDAPFASLELGRGCPFACTFCSTNDFFRRKFRVKSPERMLADMRAIASRYGIRAFDLMHDMFTVDRRRVVAFCDCMIDSGENFTWTCSARTDCVDEELLELMVRAGCESVFFGVETGSKRMQRIIDKDLDPGQARRAIEIAERLGLSTTVSLITAFPEENEDDLRQTVGMYMHSMRHAKSSPQLNILAPLAGTPIYAKHKDRMVLDDLCSEMSHQGRMQNDADRELIRKYPEIFPNFYILETPGLDRPFCLELREFLLNGSTSLRWLLTAIHQGMWGRPPGLPGARSALGPPGARSAPPVRGQARRPTPPGLCDFFAEWRNHRMANRPELSGGQLRQYYTRSEFRNDFLHYVRARLADFENPAVEALLSFHEAQAAAERADAALAREGRRVSGGIMPADIPMRARHICVMELDWDVQRAIDALKRGKRPVGIRKRKLYRTSESSDHKSRLVEITPLLARALQSCDGRRTVEEVTAALSDCFDRPEELRRYAAGCLLQSIHQRGYVEIYRVAKGAEEATCPSAA